METRIKGTFTDTTVNTNDSWSEVFKGIGMSVTVLASLSGVYFGAKGLYKLFTGKMDTENTVRVNYESSCNRVNEHHEESKDRMREDDNRTNNEIRKLKAKSAIKQDEREQILERIDNRILKSKEKTANRLSNSEWAMAFGKQFAMPDYSSIPFLATLLSCYPKEYRPAMLMHILSMCGALCFSKVRAKYLDGAIHSPSILVIVEGEHGSGKSMFNNLYKRLFEAMTESDNTKISSKRSLCIVQTIGIDTSKAMWFKILSNNQGLHTFDMESELQTVINNIGKGTTGLTMDTIRKAFNNEEVFMENASKHSACGRFKVMYNCTYTGTPQAVAKFIHAKEVEGGTASRICFATIPEIGHELPSFKEPDKAKMDKVMADIKDYREKYCYQTDSSNNDVACTETTIDLEYICEALNDWNERQSKLSLSDNIKERTKDRMRIATIAFHCAIVLHMLAGNPGPENIKSRRTVKRITLYIADYCMERYISKFSDSSSKQFNMSAASSVGQGESDANNFSAPRKDLTEEDIAVYYHLLGTTGKDGKIIGYGTIAKWLNSDKDSVRNAFNRYKKKYSL